MQRPNGSKPEPTPCERCGGLTEQFFIEGSFGIKSRWLPRRICEGCGEKERRQDEARKRNLIIEDHLMKLPNRVRSQNFSNFTVDKNNKEAFDAAQGFNKNSRGLYFFGPVGTGKTHLAAALSQKFIEENLTPVCFVSCPTLLRGIRDSFNKSSSFNALDGARDAWLLVLDDIGAERPTDWVRETLFELVNYRYERLSPIIFTSNLSPEDLEKTLGERITSRIVELCDWVLVAGGNWRLKPRNGLVD